MSEQRDQNIDSSGTEGNSGGSESKKKKGGFFRIVLILAGAFIVLIVGLLIFIQTNLFNSLLLDFALDKINSGLSEKDSRIVAGKLEGNILSGITLKDVGVIVKEDTLLRFNSLRLDYDLLPLTAKEIVVDELSLDRPQINLTKIKDKHDSLKWNVQYLLESDEIDTDTTTSEFDWGINAKSVKITGGHIKILEEKPGGISIGEFVMPQIDSFGISTLDVEDLNLDLSAEYFPNYKKAEIRNISFKTNSEFNVDSLRLQAYLDEENEIANLRDVRLLTERSDLAINFLRMTEFSLKKGISYEEFEGNDTQIDLDARVFNFDDLSFFLPQIDFLDSTVSLKLFAEGDYEDLNVISLVADLPNSHLELSGKVKNLHKPSEMNFDVTGKDMVMDPADTKRVLPGLPIPDYSYVGQVSIPYATYKGTPDNFESSVDLRSSVGNINGKASLDFSGDVAVYNAEFETSGANLGKFLKNKELESNVTGEFKVKGRGFDYRTMSGNLDYKIRSTRIYGQNIRNSEGRLEFNRGNVKLGLNYVSTTLKTKLAGSVNISNLNNLRYNLKGTVSGLDVAAFTKDNSQKSNLNFDFDVTGSGLEPDKLAGNYRIDMRESSFGGTQIPAGQLTMESGAGLSKDIILNTAFAKAEVKGSFTFNQVANSLQRNIDNLISVLMSGNDSISVDTVTAPLMTVGCDNFSLEFNLSIDDPNVVRTFSDSLDLTVKGFLEGAISDSCGVFNMKSDGYFTDLRFSDSTIVSDSVPVKIDLTNNTLYPGLKGFYADIDVSAPRMIMTGMPLDSVNARIFIIEDRDSISLSAKQDSTLDFFTSLSIEDSLTANFDSLYFRYDRFDLANNRDLSLKYMNTDSAKGIEFRKFSLTSFGQRLDVNGLYSFEDSSHLAISAKNLKVETYSLLMGNDEIDSANTLLGNIRNLEIDFDGTLRDPSFEIIAISDVLRYGKTKIGRLDADIKYSNDNTVTDITFTNINNTGDLKIKGNLPMILTFEDDTTNLNERRSANLEKDVNLSAIADNFQIKVLQQLLPYTQNLEGTLDGGIYVLGKGAEPKLSGDMKVDSGKVQITLTKMQYNFAADLQTDNAKIVIKNSRLNAPNDPTRFISAIGYVDLTGLQLNDIRLEMSGDVKAFDREYGMTELGIEGDLWVGSGKPPLILSGKQGRFDLTGNLLLVKGNITFNPFIQEAYRIQDDDFNYGIIVDSVGPNGEEIRKVLRMPGDSTLVIKNLTLNPFEKILYIESEKPEVKKVAKEKSGTFIYNVYVTTAENVFLRFIVNEKSQQEFFGSIKTDLFVDNKEDNTIAARGTVYLGDNSYYRFFRKFDASGKALFNGPVTNPELDINATYSGILTTGQSEASSFFDEVKIDLDVTGPAISPKIDITLERFGGKETGQNAASDAISYLLFGKFQNQLSFSESSTLGLNIGSSYLSGFLSTELEKILPFLINTDVSYADSKSGTVAENADIRFTAAFGDAIVRFGGQFFKGISNTDFIIDYPVGKLLDAETFSNNLILRVERVYDPIDFSTSSPSVVSGTRVGAQLYYRIKF